MTAAPVRVAVDLLGSDSAPRAVADGAVVALAEDPALDLALVGPPEVADEVALVLPDDLAGRLHVVPATDAVGMAEDPVRGVRTKRRASVRVAARLVREGSADAMVTVGSTGAAVAASVFTLGRLRGMTRPALAVVVPALAHPVVLLDVGANPDATPDVLAQFALAGATFARLRLGLDAARVGLLSIGAEAGKGDGLRLDAHRAVAEALRRLPVRFVGNVEGGDVALGGPADVVVTDGFTGNVLLKGIEGTYRLIIGSLERAVAGAGDPAADQAADSGPAPEEPAGLPPDLVAALSAGHRPLRPERFGGAVLLGVRGVVVVGHGASSERAVASCVRLAAHTARDGLVAGIADGLTDLAAGRRSPAAVAEEAPAGS